jgi:uncharacterized membrane protein
MLSRLLLACLLAAGCAPASPANPSPWEEARARGVTFRAIGQEPGWYLEIEPARWIHLAVDYGESHLYLPVVEPRPAPEGGGEVYDARTGAHSLTVTIRRVPCQDIMSGEPFDHEVVVVIDGRRLEGCGRRLARRAARHSAGERAVEEEHVVEAAVEGVALVAVLREAPPDLDAARQRGGGDVRLLAPLHPPGVGGAGVEPLQRLPVAVERHRPRVEVEGGGEEGPAPHGE